MTDDLELLRGWKGGDKAAGNALFRRHFSMLFRFFRSKVDSGVEDLVQETFLACLERSDDIEGSAGFRAYLMGVARRRLFRRFRGQDRQGRALQIKEMSVAELVRSPSAVIAAHDEQRVLLDALRQIPIDLQIVIELYYWESFPVGDVATVLEIPAGTVKSRLSRARALLRERILTADDQPDLRRRTVEQIDHWAQALGQSLAPPKTS